MTKLTAINSVLIQMDKPMQDELVLQNGVKLFVSPDYRPEWFATTHGIVRGLPTQPRGANKEVVSHLNVGDDIAFSYRVVADVDYGTVGNYFKPTTSESPFVQRFVNDNEETLTITQLPAVFGKFKPFWVGLLLDKRGNHISGIQGTESEVERWKSQFVFSGVQNFKFNNLYECNGEDLWKCDYTEIFAKKIGDEVVAVGDRIICEPIEIDFKHKIELTEGIALPYQEVKARLYDRAKVVSGGEELGIKKGDVVSFHEGYVEKYELWGKNYFLIKKRRINGIWMQDKIN